jgi:hypothetical protein
VDESLRELERRTAADPSDEESRLALACALVRSGNLDAAAERLRPSSGAGYGLLLDRAGRDPAFLALLDRAPEWRSSGGDPGCTRWSRAEPVLAPRTAWRRRIEAVHGALALAVDRGRAFVVTVGPRGTELVALSVLDGRTLWRRSLGNGPPAAPLAREGRVSVAVREGTTLEMAELEGASGEPVWQTRVEVGKNCFPGALNQHGSALFLPVPTSWRFSSRVPDGRERQAFLVTLEAATGNEPEQIPMQQIFSECPVDGPRLYSAEDFATVPGRLKACNDRRAWEDLGPLEGTPQFLAAAGDVFALATGGTLRMRSLQRETWSSIGGTITSLALDGRRVLVGRGAEFSVRDLASNVAVASWLTHESPLPYRPRGVSHAPPAPLSAVAAGDLAYLASPLAPSLSAYDARTGACAWRHEIEGLLVPEEGPRFTWPVAEMGPPDRGPLQLAPLPGRVLGITLSGYVFLVESAR